MLSGGFCFVEALGCNFFFKEFIKFGSGVVDWMVVSKVI